MFGPVVRDIFEEVEPTCEGAHYVGCIFREGAFEDVEADRARIGDDQSRFVITTAIIDDSREHLLVQPGEDAIIAWVSYSIHPEVTIRTPEGLVQIKPFTSLLD